MTNATSGIVIRQTLDASSTVLTNSPDVIVTGKDAAFDTSSFIDPSAYYWYFSRSPAIATPNYLYIRGVNYNPAGTQNSVVYLYYAQSDQILDPTKWKSSGFTVSGNAQNSVAITAISQWQNVVAASPVMWTPPQPTTSGATYFLISWIDNSANPVPPIWPTTPFATLADLTDYIDQNPTMAVLDTIYRGAFLRQFPGQSVTQDGTGAQTCPDLVVTGMVAAQDASYFTGTTSYNSGTLSQNASLGAPNFVYVRAMNTSGGAAKARVYLYWATTDDISPTGWNTTSFTYAGRTQNWVDLVATTANQVMVSTVPVVWNAAASSGAKLILIAYVDNSNSPQPPDFTSFGYVNAQAVTSFVAGHSQLAWLAINGSAAPAVTMSNVLPLTFGTGINSVYAGIQLQKIPIDGTVSLSIPGPDAANTIAIASMRVPDPNALVAWPLTYPDHFETCVVINYTAGSTPVGAANIVPTVVPRLAQR